MKKYLAHIMFASLATISSTACVEAVDDADISSTSSELSSAELANTKAAIRRLANANMTRTDNFAEVRAAMDPLVATLAAHFGERPAAAKLNLVAGAWRQLWSDFPYPMTSFITMDPRQVYQVVSADGHYWNIGDEKALDLFGLTGVLRGAYETSGTRLLIEFTNVGFRIGRLGKHESLVGLANGLESGDRYYFPIPGGGQAPKGPVGIGGTLETVYVDADLRIDVGTQDDFLDASGKVLVPGYGRKVFVLDRVTKPVK